MSRAAAEQKDGIDGRKGRVEVTKVKRYRPGQVPEWMKHDDAEAELPVAKPSRRRSPSLDLGVSSRRTGIAAPVIVRRTDDSRLARLIAVKDIDNEKERTVAAPQIIRKADAHPSSLSEQEREDDEEDAEEAIVEEARRMPPRHRDVESSEEEQEDEEAIARRRAAMRERMQQEEELEKLRIENRRHGDDSENGTVVGNDVRVLIGKQHEDALVAAMHHVNTAAQEEHATEEETSEEEEEDSSEEDDDFGFQLLVKPVFIPKSNRDTLAERDALEMEEEMALEQERKRKEERKAETKEIVAARMAEEAAQEAEVAVGPKGLEDIDTDDEDADEVEEYESWKLREMNRIARDQEEREKEVREAEEREKWKAMTEDERQEYLKREGRLGKAEDKKQKKSKYTFLQRYYHKGAFFQTEAEYKGEAAPLVGDVVNRDFSAPTGEDKFDRSALPSVMQVRNFGKRSQSKWTHLKNEDTTDFNAPWATDRNLKRKMEERMAGTSQEFTKPKNLKT